MKKKLIKESSYYFLRTLEKNVLKQRYIQLGFFWAVGLLQTQNSEQDPTGEAWEKNRKSTTSYWGLLLFF